MSQAASPTAGALVEFILENGSWRGLQSWYRHHKRSAGKSADALRTRVQSPVEPEELDLLQRYARVTLLYGTKTIRLYRPSDPSILSEFGQLPAKSLRLDFRPEDRDEPWAVKKTRHGTHIVFKRARAGRQKIEIRRSHLAAEFQSMMTDQEVGYIEKHRHIAAFDSIFVPKASSTVVFRTTERTQHGVLDVDGEVEAFDLSLRAAGLVRQHHSFLSPVDLFPAISSIYDDDTEGQVVELGFNCDSGALRNEKMRNTELDLRQEEYHVQGTQVTDIDPYRLGLQWPHQAGRAELYLPGTLSMLLGSRPLYTATVKNGDTAAHHRFAMKRLQFHLNRSTKKP